MTTASRVRLLRFADGTKERVEADLADSIVGRDAGGNLVATCDGMLYPLTPCCHASGKGTVNALSGVCCRACYAEVDPYYGSVLQQADIAAPVQPRRRRKMSRNTQPAAEQFAALGLDEADYTDAMRLAIKQRWSNLPVGEKVDDLRRRIADVETEQTPTPEMLTASGFDGDAVVEAKRLKRNAAVNAWRARNQLQAALDAREAKFAKVRAARGKDGKVKASA